MHAPKPDEQRRRRNAPTHGETVLPRDNELRGPELAELSSRTFGDDVLAWYDDWRRSPQAAVHWTVSNGGHALARVIRRNLAKSRDRAARAIETTNAHAPGEDTVAELSFP
ncbi:hypothetical protein BG844_37965 [Couchioplanes caeruleus subsp. caeruleus]|uniref:Uncharacterized protein n=2 Tax=Couchioplanes caeruleus TaxID=56438 RepID=A0A1K0F940_9ACTN|nr:hypothetical protein BG844_37965 [Couchioplanes caeruleus subsp. caeruleus]